MKSCYKGTSVIMMLTFKINIKKTQHCVNLARTATRDEFATNSQPDTTPHIDLLKQTQ